MRVMKWIAVLIALVLATGTVAAQGSAWSAYLYNSVTRQLVRVNLDGTQTPINLNLPEGAYLGESETAFTDDGNQFAYCLIDFSAGGTSSPARLVVMDVLSGTVLYQQDLGASMGCWVEYSADNSMLAVSMVNYYSGDTSADMSRPIFELRILDADSGGQMASLSPFSNGAAELGLLNDFSLMPLVRYFDNNQIIFTVLPWGTESVPIEPAFLWDLNSSALQPFDDWWHVGLAINGTEVVWLDADPSLPAGDPGGPVPANNVVRMRNPQGDLVTLYHSPDWVLLDSQFIDSGRRLALSLLEPFNPNAPDVGSDLMWIALDRAGGMSQLLTTTGFSQLANAPDGYVVLTASSPNPGATMTLDYHIGDQMRTLFTATSDNSGAAWMMIWSTPVASVPDLPPFPTR